MTRPKFELAELKAEVLSIKTTVDYCVQHYIDGHNDPATASMAKLIAADQAVAVVDHCVQSSAVTATCSNSRSLARMPLPG